MAIVTIALSLTPALAPMVGGLLLLWFEWRSGFAVCALMGVVTLLLAWRLHPETLPAARRIPLHPVTLLQTYARIARNWRFHAYVLSYSLLNCCFTGFIVTGPAVLMRQEGLSAWDIAVLLLVIYLGFALGNLYAARHVRRTGVDRMIAYGIAISLLGSLLLIPGVRLGGIAAVAVPLFINCIGNGLTFPTGIAGAVNLTPDRAGTAAALVSAIQLMIGAAFAWFCGSITGGDLMPFSWACLGASIAGGLFAVPLYLARTPKED
jgi:DHA1 family bicyclomycin/chloramphenicol resistance-like MFS transporter